ncbi:putative calcium-binding hemolysin protein [Desulfobacula toluolica Tol2]|uniref:Putative calcium-binding hemolysin protein n=2 Tax=Desulfobacula toluolica TaxID=28223 RepID=K0NLD0_DESTT|nr:putative calcium-binding hemolysin protein [Desulfobacula toluolica Tol2]
MKFFTVNAPAGIPLSFAVNMADGDKPYEALLKAIFESLATTAGASALAAAGAGTVAVSFGSVFVGYTAVTAASELIDRYIGVDATSDIGTDRLTYEFEIGSGKFSDFLYPRGGIAQFFDGLFLDTEANVWEEYDLVNAESWILKHANASEEPLKIEYSKAAGFTFTGTVTSALSSLYHSSDEHNKAIGTIVTQYNQNFDATVNGTTRSITNYSDREIAILANAAINGSVEEMTAIGNLTPFYEAGVASKIPISNQSDQFWMDRAEFTYYLLHGSTKDIWFHDKALDVTLEKGVDTAEHIRHYQFGHSGIDNIGTGHLHDLLYKGVDHLYGMGGNDTLKGHGGEDHIEGGEGQDTMYGGDGKDIFYIQGEDDDYDVFNGGAEEDTIRGSDGDDTIRVHDFSGENGENTVEIIDGRGGENIIAGTDMADTIDLSGTALIDIDRIEGGDGADTIKGCLADDTIYGGSKEKIEDNAGDRLEGGAGNDTYYAGTGDIINDLDGRGTIWFEGQDLSELTWTGLSPDSNIYSDSDENYYALFDENSNTLIVSHTSTNHSIKIEDFSDGTLGLTLEDYTPPGDYDHTLVGSADDDESDYHPDYDLGTYSYGFGDNADITADMSTSISLEIYGGAGSDYILGLPWDDYLNGGGGDDHIVSNSNSTMAPDIVGDVMDGGDGNDLIQDTGNVGSVMLGGAGFDILTGYRGNDTMSGGSQTDVLTGHAGDDYLSGGDGNDVLLGDNDLFWTNSIMGMLGPDMVDFTFDQANGWITDVNFNGVVSVKDGDTITVTGIGGGDIYFDIPAGNDFLDGGDGSDYLYSGGGNDILNGGTGADTLGGGIGDDMLYGGAGNDQLQGGDGNDHLYGEQGNDLLFGQKGNDVMDGGAGKDQLQGGEGDDILNGQDGDDYLLGGDGNDTLTGDSGNDIMEGGEGADTYKLQGGGDDVIIDSQGASTVEFISEYSEIRYVSYEGGQIINNPDGNDLLVVFDANNSLVVKGGRDAGLPFTYLIGSQEISHTELLYDMSEDITGTNGDDIIDGQGGDDNIDGGAGSDTIYGGPGHDNLHGGSGDDNLYGGDDWDVIFGGTGDDTIFGGTDDDYLYGQEGNDTLDGGDGSDFLYADIGNDTLIGGSGDDHLYGDEGSDTLSGGAGNDFIKGGIGDDVYLFGIGDGQDTLWNKDSWRQDSDILRFGAGISDDDIIATRSYNDFNYNDLFLTIQGTGDSIRVDSWFTDPHARALEVELSDGTPLDRYLLEQTSLVGTDQDDKWISIWDDHSLRGGKLNDVFDGRAGNDELYGGTGDDVYLFGRGDGQDTIYEVTGTDTIRFKNGIDPADVEVWQDAGNLCLGIKGTDDNITVKGTWPRMILGNRIGCQIERVEFNDGTVWGETALYGDPFHLSGTEGSDYMEGSVNSDHFLGLAGNDYLYGKEGDDTLYGGSGNDRLGGDDGNDVLSGGAGSDRMIGDTGDDVYIYNRGDGQDIINDNDRADGLDTLLFGADITELDVLALQDGDNLVLEIKNSNDQVTIADYYAAEYSVNNTRFDNKINRVEFSNGAVWDQAMIQTMVGGDNQAPVLSSPLPDQTTALDDIFTFQIPDTTFTDPDKGDVLSYSATLSDGSKLPFWLNFDSEKRIFSGTPSAEETISVTVTATDQKGLNVSDTFDLNVEFQDLVIEGTSGDDVLEGTAGNDIFQGGKGNDLLSGGDGDDTYLFNLGDGTDRISDSQGTDTIRFGEGITSDDISLDLGSLLLRVGDQGDEIHIEDFNPDDPLTSSAIESFQFAYGSKLDISDLLQRGFDIDGTQNDDLLAGTAVSDRISGEEGADTLAGGKGNDILTGGSGSDTYVFNLGDGDDTIEDVSNDTEGNLIEFGTGITVEDLTFEQDGNDLIIHVGSQGDALRLKDFDRFGHTGSLVTDTLQFTDGSQAGLADLVNTAPAVSVALQDQTATEDFAFNYILPPDTFTDADIGDSLTYTASLGNDQALPLWLFFDPNTVAFSGTPEDGDAGILDVTVTATDTAGDYAVTRFSLDVANYLAGSSWGDVITGTDLRDVIEGFEGNDTLNGGAGDDTFIVEGSDQGYNKIGGGEGYDKIVGGTGDDTIRLNSFKDDRTVEEIDGGEGTNIIAGGTANYDYLDFSATTLTNIDRIDAGSYSDTVIGSNEADVIIGGTGNDTLNGGGGDDTFIVEGSDQGYDRITGSDGYDRIIGGTDDDTIRLNNFRNDQTVEEIDGGEGNNIVAGGTANYDYLDFSATKLTNIAWINAGSHSDTVIGSSEADVIIGGTGNDTLNGGGGDDTFIVEGSDHGYDRITGGDGYDRIIGGTDDDTIRLNNFRNDQTVEEIDGGEGNNIVAGGTANYDYLDFSATKLTNIHRIDAGSHSDTVIGSSETDVIIGGTGNDTLNGGGGDDTFIVEGSDQGYDRITGGDGYDRIIGGTDDDTIRLNNFRNDQTVEEIDGGEGNNIVAGGTANYDYLDFSATKLTNIAWINAGSHSDTVIGSSEADVIIGGTGNDTLNGGGGDDTFIVEGSDQGYDRITGGDGYDRIIGGTDDDTIRLNNFRNDQTVEEIDGGEGNNIVAGGTANYDYLDFSATKLTNIAWINAGSHSDTVIGSSEADVIIGGTGNDTLNGGGGDDTFIVEGSDQGYDRITGGDGYDRIIGGTDDDTIRLNNFRNDQTVEEIDGGEGNNIVAGGTANYDYLDFSATKLTNIAWINAGSHSDTVIGSSEADVIIGGTGNDTLDGGAGDDVFRFSLGDGSDTLSISSGLDSIEFGADVEKDSIVIFQNSNGLQIGYGVSDLITITDDTGPNNEIQVGNISLADGSYLTGTDVNQLMQEMSAYADSEGLNLNSLDDVQQDIQLMGIITESWQEVGAF